MSHFTVLVVTEAEPTAAVLEKVLAPFHEYECTGWNNEFVIDVDQTEEVQQQIEKEGDLTKGLAYYGLDGRIVEDESMVDRHGDHQWGYAVVKDGKLVKAVDRTNPNKKWDWYVLGGRWQGMLLPKDRQQALTGQLGAFDAGHSNAGVDACRISNLDIETMRNRAGDVAREEQTKLRKAVKGLTLPSFEKLCEEHGIEKAREIYNADPAILALRDAGEIWIDQELLDSIAAPLEEVVEKARANALVTFAVLKDGKWYERGEMGWWGMVSNEQDRDEWTKQFSALIDSLSPDTWISVVDCHI